MKTAPVTFDDIPRSVIAVPPLARNADLEVDEYENCRIIGYLENGGVRTLMYGGNANFYNVGVYEYAALVDFLGEQAGNDTWIVPSIGPDFGRMMDQADILRRRDFPTAMVLPQQFPATIAGAEDGIRRAADRMGRPVIIYIKAEGYLSVEAVERLARDGLVAAIKYAVVRKNPAKDGLLSQLVQSIDRRLIISGIGERPAIAHMTEFGLPGFTSGSVCVGPRGSMALLRAVQAGRLAEAKKLRQRYIPLEDLRDEMSPIRVLHDAVMLAGVANTGPILPLLSNLSAEQCARVKPVAAALRAADEALAGAEPQR
ncbi:MAG: dihydrodipicolinate synthase family protein [Alphaproteobacteria bacterium]|nr:dihydrodipicolinate synthase family protein [Alphaproteobacteria bacterium]